MKFEDIFTQLIVPFLMVIFAFVLITFYLNNMQDKVTYNTIITNPYQGCIKGYCSMEGFKCLDEPTKPFSIDNASCQCTEKGYACTSS